MEIQLHRKLMKTTVSNRGRLFFVANKKKIDAYRPLFEKCDRQSFIEAIANRK